MSPSAGEDDLALYLKWLDVQRARGMALAEASAAHAQIAALRVNGRTEEQIAAWLNMSDSTVRRRFTSTLDAILDALGGELAEAAAAQRVPLCLICGDRPRCRVVTYGPKRRGQPRQRHERPTAICRECATAAAERAGTEPPTFATLIESKAA